jgi:hypothetical protein
MKSRKTYQTTLRDLRDIDPAKFAVVNVSRECAVPDVSYEVGMLHVVTPGVDGSTTSQPAHE